MTINSQPSTSKPKKQKQKRTEQTTRTGTDSQKSRSQGGLSAGRGKKYREESSRNGRYKIDRGMLRIVWEMEKPKNLYV